MMSPPTAAPMSTNSAAIDSMSLTATYIAIAATRSAKQIPTSRSNIANYSPYLSQDLEGSRKIPVRRRTSLWMRAAAAEPVSLLCVGERMLAILFIASTTMRVATSPSFAVARRSIQLRLLFAAALM